jgi:hypothetical protein
MREYFRYAETEMFISHVSMRTDVIREKENDSRENLQVAKGMVSNYKKENE